MKIKSKKEIELEKKVAEFKDLLDKAKKEDQSETILEFLKNHLDEFQEKLKEIRSRTRGPKTYFKVEFAHPNKVIDFGTSKENYIKSIREFGIQKIKSHMPDFFQNHEEKGFERLEPNVYLDIRKNNNSMIASLNTIAEKTGRKIICGLIS